MSATNRRVLVAEDSPSFARVIQFNLQQAGFDVTLARNGLEGWERAQGNQYDIVLMDQQMPELTGTELCARLRSLPNYADIPVILISAKGLEMDAEQLEESLGISTILPKPFSVAELLHIVEDALAPAA